MSRIELKYLLLIIVIFIAACIETDIYLPAFPDMMRFFAVSEEMIQSLLTWNFIGICLSGPLYGPLSDSMGRKKPLIVALGLFLLGSAMTLVAQGFELMLWGRLLQGLGSGGCFTLGTAIIFDAFEKERAAKALSKLNTIIPLIMAAAPMLGGYLNNAFGFRSNFLAIGIFVLVSFVICVFFFDETLPEEQRAPFQGKKVLGDFRRACSSVSFWQLTAIVSLLFTGYLVFLSGSVVLFVEEFGVQKEHFPFYQAALLGAWVCASLICDRVIDSWGAFKVKLAGTILVVSGGLGMVIVAVLAPQSPLLLTAVMTLYAFGANWTQSLYFPEGMELLPDIKGVTASLLTSFRLLITAVIIELIGQFYNGTVFPVLFAVVGIVAVILPTIILYERGKMTKEVIPAV